MNAIETHIRTIMPDLSHAERVAAAYLLRNFDSFLTLSSDELARKSKASKATWTRFSKSAGFEGLKDLRKAVVANQPIISTESALSTDSWLFEAKNESNISDIITRIADINSRAVLETVNLVNTAQYIDAAKAIVNASAVRIYGIGASGTVASDLTQKLQRIGKHALRCNDFHDAIALAASAKSNDVSIFITYSGKTTEIVRLAEICRKTGTITIVITRDGTGRMAETCDYCLLVSACEEDKRIGAMSSRIAQLTAIDILFTLVLRNDNNQVEHDIKRSYEISRQLKDR